MDDDQLRAFFARCKGSIAVVGNGALTDAQRADIDGHQCVVRFNDMKNRRADDKTTVQVTRLARGEFAGVAHNEAGVPLWPVSTTHERVEELAEELAEETSARLLPPLLVHEATSKRNDLPGETTLFDSCDVDVNRRHDAATSGPSTGGVVLDALHRLDVGPIDVYGMNWNGTHAHVDFRAPTLVSTCCTSCRIHPTPVPAYDSRSAYLRAFDDIHHTWQRAKCRAGWC